MTANAMVEDRDACAAAGMESYLSKPVRGRELERLLNQVRATLPHSAVGTARSARIPPQTPPVPTEPLPAVDEAVLARLREQIEDDDGSLLSELVSSYVVEACLYLDQLAAAVGVADAPAVRWVAHTWSSSSAVLGADALAELLRETETAALEAPETLSVLVERIEDEHERVAAFLRSPLGLSDG